MKITKVYTRTGDKGMTSLVGGVRIKKSDIRLEAYGTVDELSAHLGMLVSMINIDEERSLLIRVQNNLFNVCTHLATDQSQTPLYPSAHLAEGEIEFLEERIDKLMKALPERQGFILPGGVIAACQAHICRTVCRRAERCIAALAEVAQIDQEMQMYVNRLSDYLFVLAKIINFNEGKSEIIWENACK
ncbi:MAG: cob(I)yrinic acid a,c-diamide adenosyltransferase [Prevotella sp.]|jgi:cob(I)alamin adenosyltransferase|nr:cob(I)yrinic acid a,c-diamide adenosyltransferase [Prevotella sp.]MBR1768114.1 cob(I)yrinic acid a,c-diamide adenosyltransferase [Prevotella sp.]